MTMTEPNSSLSDEMTTGETAGAPPVSLVFRALDEHVIHGRADYVALTDGAGSLTYAQLLHDSASVAGALREIGIGIGTTVQIDLLTGREQVMALLALARLGAEPGDGEADFRFAGEPAVLYTHDTEVPWNVLLHAGRVDPVAAPATDPDGYEQRLRAAHEDVFATLTAGETLL